MPKSIPESDINLQIEEGKDVYLAEKNDNKKEEITIKQVRNRLYEIIDTSGVPFSRIDIDNIYNNWGWEGVLRILYNINKNNTYHTEQTLTPEEEKEWENRNKEDLEIDLVDSLGEWRFDIPEFINNKIDTNENYDYNDYYNETPELKKLNQLVKEGFSTEVDIDFNSLNEWDIIKITHVIREKYEKISKETKDFYFYFLWFDIYLDFINKSNLLHKNMKFLDKNIKDEYLNNLINLLMLLNSNEWSVLKYF